MRRAAALLCALCAATTAGALASPPVPAAATPSCAPVTYQAALAGAAAALRRSPPAVPEALARLARATAAAPQTAALLAPVRADLAGSTPDITDASLRLEVLARTLAYPPGSVCHLSSAAARAVLHGVYASPDFRHLDDTTGTSWVDRVLGFLRDVITRAASSLGTLGSLLLGLAVLALASFLVWRRWHGDAALGAARAAEPAAPGDDPDAEWVAGERAAAAGDHREAVRRAFRAALLEVAGAAGLRVDAAWTTREVLARCRAEGDLLAALAGAAALFDRAWYSGHPVSAADYALARDRCSAVRRLARRARAVT